MKAEFLADQLEPLLARGCEGDLADGENDNVSHGIIAYENERHLVAWVVLANLPQEQLDEAWQNNEKQLSSFACCLLTSIDESYDGIVNIHAAVTEGDDIGDDIILCACYLRLMAQVTARLTSHPSDDLKSKIYKAWKRVYTIIFARSKVNRGKELCSTIVALNTDVYYAFMSWMDHDDHFFSAKEIMKEIWNAYVTACTMLQELPSIAEEENCNDQKNQTSIEAQKDAHHSEKIVMINVLRSILEITGDKKKTDAEDCDSIYTIGNVQRILFVIFELQNTECVPEELVSDILLWSFQEEKFNPELRILRDEWLMKNIRDCISKKNKDTALLRDTELIDAMQRILLAHTVSPNAHALRPVAWQCINQIVKHGWNWIRNSSINTSICTWCQLACGEWKIQLEEDTSLTAERSTRIAILDGCAGVILSVVQYLVDFDEEPDNTIALEVDLLLSIKQSLEETLSLTSIYLKNSSCINDKIESGIIIHLWSELVSEMGLLPSKGVNTMITCLGKLLLESSDESLMQALVFVVSTSTHSDEDEFPNGLEEFDSAVISPAITYIEKFWLNIGSSDSLGKHYSQGIVHSACVVTEFLAENRPESFRKVTNSIFEALSLLAETLQFAPKQQRAMLAQALRPILDSCIMLLKLFGEILETKSMSLTISSAVEALKDS